MIPDDVEKYIDKNLPDFMKDAAREFSEKVLSNISSGKVTKEGIRKMIMDMKSKADDEFTKAKPIKTLKFKPKVAKEVRANKLYLAKVKKEVEALGEQHKKIDARVDAIKNEVLKRREYLVALLKVEMGISGDCSYRINDETMELEVISE